MNLHIFGHSICLRSQTKIPTFTDILVDKFSIQPHQLHVALCGSEERILYTLKKVKESIDVAIIFHSDPGLAYVPSLDRDFHPSADSYIYEKTSRIDYYKNIIEDRSASDIQQVPANEFNQAYKYFLKYFYTRDLNANRHYGALIQIDQYLNYKRIPVMHCVLDRSLPTWFKFTSGVTDFEICQMQKNTSKYYVNKQICTNKISAEGNLIIANKLIDFVSNLAPRVGLEPTL